MAAQEHKASRERDDDPQDTPPPQPAAAHTQVQGDEVDALLDEIDDVLESNAEEFVKGFVQKGGQ